MSWLVGLRDLFLGTDSQAAVTPDGALRVVNISRHAGDLNQEQLTRDRLYNDRLVDASGSPDMNVDGSVTPVEFDVPSTTDEITSIRGLRMVFHSGDCNMGSNDVRRFGDAAGFGGLTNGLQIIIKQAGVETSLTPDPIIRMGDFFTYTLWPEPANVVDGITVGTDLLVWVIDFKQLIPIPISDSSLDRVFVRVRDDLTAIQLFQTFLEGEKEPATR